MKKHIVPMLLFLIPFVALLYLLHVLAFATGLGAAVVLLYIVCPLLFLAVPLTYGVLRGFGWPLPLAAAALFLPTVFIFYNRTVLPFVAVYAALGLVGLLVGCRIRKSKSQNRS